MAIQINGNGTITGISVGGLPDGIVDTDMLANNAVTGAKSTGFRRLTYGSWLNPTGTQYAEFTGIAATKEFYIDWDVCGVNDNGNLKCEIGTSSGYETSGYHNTTGFLGSSSESSDTGTTCWLTYGTDSALQHRTGRMRFLNLDGINSNTWMMEFYYIVDSEGNVYAWRGTKTLSGALTKVRFYTENGGNWDQGRFRYVKVED